MFEKYGRIKNRALKWGGNVMTFTKTNEKEHVTAAVVGAGGHFAGAMGTNKKATVAEAAVKWTNEFIARAKKDGVRKTIKEWKDAQTHEQKVLEESKSRKGQAFAEDISEDKVPVGARDVMTKMCAGVADLKGTQIQVTRRTRKKGGGRIVEKMQVFKGNREKISELMRCIDKQCLLSGGTGVERIFKVGRDDWELAKASVMAKVDAGVKLWPVVGVDTEGGGTYFQIGWVGETGLEAAVTGPNFVPPEFLAILRNESIYKVGRSIHEDMEQFFGSARGKNAVELSVLTLDLPDSCAESKPLKSSLGQLAFEATSVSFEHIKRPRSRPEWKKFINIRERGWDKANIGNAKIVYAALDVTMPIVIAYNFVLHWLAVEKINELNSGSWEVSWDTLLSKALGPVVDRIIDQRLMTR